LPGRCFAAVASEFHIKIASSLFEVGEVKKEVKIWNSRTQEKEAEKGGCLTNEESTAENPRIRNTGSVIDRQVSGRREPPADWRAGMPLKPALSSSSILQPTKFTQSLTIHS
jgi:hypothetical protein